DNEQEIFQTAAFFKNSKYQFSTNTYSDILDAYNSAVNNQDIPIHLCTFNHEIVHEFNVELVTRSLECYLAGEDFHNNFSMYAMFSSENKRRKAYYGINVYNAIIIMLTDLINGTREHFDIRALQVLYDHKNIMVKRLEFCLSHGFLNDSNLLNHFSRLAKELEYIRNMSLKYMFTNDAKLIEKMVYQLDEIREQEVRATNELIMELKKGMGGQTS
ncbi:hypothetical protein ACE6ED_27040, partial [Paenibacillus sp. CN-4]|uniref:hypothetical protein n=1 Tax=Paenibacillus nanchangensis TaxID=3348343 RepID=UPI00397C6084